MATINPFQGPINYTIDVQSPFEAALGGMKMGSVVAEMEAAKQARERAQTAQTELANLFNNPNATAADYERVVAFLPKDQAAIVTQGYERKTKDQQQNSLKQAGEVFTAMKSGQTDIAKKLLRNQVTAFRNSGREEDAKATETYLELIDMNPTGAQTTIGLMIATLPGGKDVLENIDKTLSTTREEALAPSALKKAKADADKAVSNAEEAVSDAKIKAAKATTAVETEAAALALAEAQAEKAKADAEKAKVDADVAEQTKEATVIQKKSEAQSAAVAAKFAESKAAMELTKQGFDITKIQEDIKINKENARIAAMNSQIARENNDLRRQELVFKRKEAEEKRDTIVREKAADLQSALTNIDNMLNTADRVLATPKNVVGAAAGPVSSRSLTVRQSTADFEELIRTLGSQAFLAQIPNMVSKGSLSDAEGAKLEASLQSFSLRQSPERLLENVTEAQRLLTKGRKNLIDRSGLPGRRADRPASAAKVTVGGKTYTRPATMTDTQWDDYKRSVGAQ
jgi:hypothetical protein